MQMEMTSPEPKPGMWKTVQLLQTHTSDESDSDWNSQCSEDSDDGVDESAHHQEQHAGHKRNDIIRDMRKNI